VRGHFCFLLDEQHGKTAGNLGNIILQNVHSGVF